MSKHLTFEDRVIIETQLSAGVTPAEIAEILGKARSTIGREIRKHRQKTPVSLEETRTGVLAGGVAANGVCMPTTGEANEILSFVYGETGVNKQFRLLCLSVIPGNTIVLISKFPRR